MTAFLENAIRVIEPDQISREYALLDIQLGSHGSFFCYFVPITCMILWKIGRNLCNLFKK